MEVCQDGNKQTGFSVPGSPLRGAEAAKQGVALWLWLKVMMSWDLFRLTSHRHMLLPGNELALPLC